MKEIFDTLIQIIEQSNGIREKMEEDLRKYYETHQQVFEQAQRSFLSQLQDSMKTLSAMDLGKMVESMIFSLKNMVGKENFEKILEFQKQYPFLNQLFEKIMPKAS